VDVLDSSGFVKDPRIRVFSTANQGVSAARNFGMIKARGQFLALMDHDDLWHERKLELQTQYLLANPEVDACLTWFLIGRSTRRTIGLRTHLVNPKNYQSMMAGWLSFKSFGGLVSSSLMFRITDNVTQFDLELSSNADLDFILRYSLDKNIEILPSPIVFYRDASSGMHFNPSSMAEFVRISHTFPSEMFGVSGKKMVAAASGHQMIMFLAKKNLVGSLIQVRELMRLGCIHYAVYVPFLVFRKRFLSWMSFIVNSAKIKKLWNEQKRNQN